MCGMSLSKGSAGYGCQKRSSAIEVHLWSDHSEVRIAIFFGLHRGFVGNIC